MKSASFFAKAILLTAVIPCLLPAYSTGPDATVAGVPGESDCTACHSTGSGSGSVKVTFASGGTYAPGVKQHFTVTVADPAQRRWGFELTARQANNTTQAGMFTPGTDGYTQLVCTQAAFQTETWGRTCPSSMPMQYIEHTSLGTRLGTTKSANFDFDWTPPATDVGPVNIYIAANAANGDGNTTGDHIYTAHYTLTSAAPVPTPSISYVVNSAGFQTSVAAGSFVTIAGTNLANSARTWGAADLAGGNLPTSLDGVSVTIDNKPAYVNYISPTQLNVIAPADSSLGGIAVVVNNNGVSGPAHTVLLASSSPAVFLWSGKYAVATQPDYSWVGPSTLFPGYTTPAKPGDTVILWGTGFGATSPPTPDGQFAPATPLYSLATLPTATIGGISATVYSAVLTPTSAGLYQIALQIPPAAPDGDLALVLQVAGIQSPGGVYITVQH